MKTKIWSSSVIGRLANIFSLLFIVLIVLKMLALIRLPLPTPAIAVLGIAGLVLALVSFIKNKDRSILTFLSIIVGIIIILWTAGEILL